MAVVHRPSALVLHGVQWPFRVLVEIYAPVRDGADAVVHLGVALPLPPVYRRQPLVVLDARALVCLQRHAAVELPQLRTGDEFRPVLELRRQLFFDRLFQLVLVPARLFRTGDDDGHPRLLLRAGRSAPLRRHAQLLARRAGRQAAAGDARCGWPGDL